MCNKNRGKLLLIRTIVAFVLAAVMIAALVLPIFKVGTYDVQTSDEYTEGVFTKYAKPVGEIDVGLLSLINIGVNFRDIYDMLRIQSLDSKITYLTNEAMTLYSEYSAAENEEEKAAIKAEVDELVEKAAESADERKRLFEEIDEARQIELANKLQDREFCKSLVLSYLVVENFTDTFVETDTSVEKAAFATNTAGNIEVLIVLAIEVCLACFLIALVIAFVVKLLIFIVKLITKKCDEDYYEKAGRFSLANCALTFFALFLLWSIVSSLEISMEIGLIMMLSAAVASALSATIFRALLNNKNIVDTLLNATVCLVAIFLAVFLALSLLKVDALYDYKKSAGEYTSVYFVEAMSDTNVETVEHMNMILEQIAKANVKNTIIILTVSVAIAIFLVCSISYFIRQLERNDLKRADGRSAVSRVGIVLCVLLLVVSLVPSFVGTSSVEKQYNSIEKGNYKVLWYAYLTEGTTTAQAYTECVTTYSSLVHDYEAVNEKIEIAEGDELVAYQNEREELIDYTWMIGLKLNRLRVDKKSGASVCMAAAAALLVTQFIYTFIMNDDKKKKLVTAEGEEVIAETAQEAVTEADEEMADAIEASESAVEAETDEPAETEDQNSVDE